MSAYPDLPGPRSRALARDALVVLLLIVFAWLGVRVYHVVNELTDLGRGVSQVGSSVRSGFASAASAADNLPLAGGSIAGALRDAGKATGGQAVAIGQAGEHSAHHVAVLLGLLTWALPTALLLALVLPRRIREVRRLQQLRRALAGPNPEPQERLLALRALLTLPDETLFAYSGDPVGDLLAGRHEGLTAAELETLGLSARSLRGRVS